MFSHLVIATDGSPTAERAVERGMAIAAETGAMVTLVTAAQPEQGETVVEDARKRHADTGVRIETVVRTGDAASAILDVAEEVGADLIVVGNKGMQGAKRFFLSSVPNKVAHNAPCGILIVKTT